MTLTDGVDAGGDDVLVVAVGESRKKKQRRIPKKIDCAKWLIVPLMGCSIAIGEFVFRVFFLPFSKIVLTFIESDNDVDDNLR